MRPDLPLDFDQTRAAVRAADPAGWAFAAGAAAGLYRAIGARRDIRRFRPDQVPDAVLRRCLEAAHAAPSVGLMQPWRFILVRDLDTRTAMRSIAERQRLIQAPFLDARASEYLDLKLEGIAEAPLSVCVCCDRRPGEEILGRHSIPDTDLYSTCLAIENLWLAARAEGVGIGWVSLYDEDEVRALLGIPPHVVPVAWLCVGYPDERPVRPGLEAAGWGRRTSLADHVFSERWPDADAPTDAPPARTAAPPAPTNPSPALFLNPHPDEAHLRKAPVAPTLPETDRAHPGCAAADDTHDTTALAGPAAVILPADPAAAVAARDRSDELIKPPGSLGALETLVERWAAATGSPPPPEPRAAILVLAADHGVFAQRTSLYPQRVSAQVAAAAARGESAVGVLARTQGASLIVADIGLVGPRVPGLLDVRIREASADITLGAALSPEEFSTAWAIGERLADEAIRTSHADVLVLGEIGIANTTVASALLAALTGRDAGAVVGRGAGLDAQGLERKRATVTRALTANPPVPTRPLEMLRRLGGLEFAGLAGAMSAAASTRTPILLDGFSVGVVALAAVRARPALRDYLIAGHRSAEPAHAHVLTELGLEPLLDLRLRLGEASGAALALPLIGLAGAVHAQMASFDEAGVDRARPTPTPTPTPTGTASETATVAQ